eukprot:TRINITY_DN24949_c0_g1_i2.p1 TRINITY_DN24949_c0_g1~~TRINITY_DN24949_c0_g1_i2.p1  ORF type:complete len:275 (+),score=23.44 TRINITY_DN24949_c0_g1_i2:158-982(+)
MHVWLQLMEMHGHNRRALLSFSHFDEAFYAAVAGLEVSRLQFGARHVEFATELAREREARNPRPLSPEQSNAKLFVRVPDQILLSRVKQLFWHKYDGDLLRALLEELMFEGFAYRFIQYQEQYDYSILHNFRASVFFPWNWELITFLEWVGIGLPTFVPGPEFAVPHTLNRLVSIPEMRSNQSYLANLRPELMFKPPHDVAFEASSEHVARWWAYTDFARTPQVRRFAHLGDLMWQILSCDFESWAQALRRANLVARADADRHYGLLLQGVLPT